MSKTNKNGTEKAPVKFTTSNGHVITVKSVPPFLLDNILQSVQYPEVPTYEAETASGEKEIHPHDETTLETEKDRQMWEQYKIDLEAAQTRENELMMNTMFLKGLDIDLNTQAFEDWKEEQEFLGQELPTNKAALKVRYISTEILSSLDDLSKIMGLIMEQSGVSEEVVAQALSSFQSAISRVVTGNAETQTGEMAA